MCRWVSAVVSEIFIVDQSIFEKESLTIQVALLYPMQIPCFYFSSNIYSFGTDVTMDLYTFDTFLKLRLKMGTQ